LLILNKKPIFTSRVLLFLPFFISILALDLSFVLRVRSSVRVDRESSSPRWIWFSCQFFVDRVPRFVVCVT
jgi:hypothetical protein